MLVSGLQSEDERLLKRLARKEERRNARRREDDQDSEEQLRTLGFDPKQMRAQRCVLQDGRNILLIHTS